MTGSGPRGPRGAKLDRSERIEGRIATSSSTLWGHRDFLLLWLGQSVSRVGDQFTALAIPVIAAYLLGAGPAEMGFLGAAGTFPFLLFGLLVGVWVDRRSRRSVLLLSDVGRGTLIALTAVLGLLGILLMAYLYVIAFLIGVLTVFFDVAYQAYLPALVDRTRLVDANSKLETSNSLAATGGPAVAGAIIQVLKAPAAMVFDAASFFVSASTLYAIRTREAASDPAERRSVLAEVREGLAVVFGDRRLRYIAACTAWSNFFTSAVFSALLILFLKDDLGFDPLALGFLFGLASVGGVIGAVVASPLADRIGVGPAIVVGAVLFGTPALPLPFVEGAIAFPAIAAMLLVTTLGSLVYNINQVSFRQAIVPVRLQGRLNATMRTIVWGTMPIGALFGGLLGEILPLRQSIFVGLAGGTVAFLFVLLSPVRQVQAMPEPLG